ncbi:carboxymuconolactone decarboxylase family protein [Duganella callida]|uniref:4-carboxymuconolactone decarboxylase n=1 Tax=Duganella callida TaxID=2561932 RepID=A0A4Y9T103_9BURK|nr:carboxymuconolactone decarboxylase family protein [Duganella callida]TFW31240.1 4-carboxymuconolactone decarboxylase [Duganella callida]
MMSSNAPSTALERYTAQVLLGDVWQRPLLSMRDRAIVTMAVLIARNQSTQLPPYLERALDHGVRPSEISGLIAHLAFYSGWANALAAEDVARPIFARRGIDAGEPAPAALLPLDESAEQRRHAIVERKFGAVAPGLVQLTSDVIFRDLWRQPALSVRDRCLVTIGSVIATAQTAQLAFYLNRAMDNGVSRAELSEVMTQVAFYSGWSSVYTALAVMKEVFEGRPD